MSECISCATNSIKNITSLTITLLYSHLINDISVITLITTRLLYGDDDDCPNSLIRRKEVAQREEEEEAGDRRKERQAGTPTPGADAPTSPTQVSIGCEEQEKTLTVVCGSTPQEGQRGLGISLILSRYEWRE